VEEQESRETKIEAVKVDKPFSHIQTKNIRKLFFIILSIIFLIGSLTLVATFIISKKAGRGLPFSPKEKQSTKIKVQKFSGVDEFKAYLSESKKAVTSSVTNLFAAPSGEGKIGAPSGVFESQQTPPFGSSPQRVSETNVQVAKVDEPDIVKADKKSIFFSTKNVVYPLGNFPLERPMPSTEEPLIYPQPANSYETKVISSFPPQNLAKDASITRSGDLLLTGDNLIILSVKNIYGYDVSDRKNPKELWNFELESGNSIVSARLFGGKIYLITQKSINEVNPCPIPLGKIVSQITIECGEIYRPENPLPIDTTFNILVLNPKDGSVLEKASFVALSNQSVTYINPKFLYITYTFNESVAKFYTNFLKERARDLFPQEVIKRLDEIEGYNISESSKLNEIFLVFERYYLSLKEDERKRIENEFENRIKDYSREHIRDLIKTAIVKIRGDNLEVLATGEVPGLPLNQFSLDEYQGNLRIATTSSGNFFASTDSVNDVYVLDENLNVIGSIEDLGLTERIYSARFVEDKGYLVTFRQIDPFYVLNLSNPKNPKKAGELKIPGFSSYLHPISKDKILGVGREDQKVKLSLFDVTNPENPVEADKYNMDEYWSSVTTTHHAFLIDDKHQVFFLPAGQSGYIFSYKNDKLVLQRVVSNISAQRAIYIDDYLYVIGDSKIVVLDEQNWSEVNSLSF